MNIEHTPLTLELNSIKNFNILEVRQGDANSRCLDVKLTINGEPLTLTSNMSAKINATNNDIVVADGVNAAINVEKDIIEVNLSKNMLSLPGLLKIDVMLYEGNQLITAETFSVRVGQSVINGDSKFEPQGGTIGACIAEIDTARGINTSLNERLTATETAISGKADKATTLEGYGIADAYNKTQIDTMFAESGSGTGVATYPKSEIDNKLLNKVDKTSIAQQFDELTSDTSKLPTIGAVKQYLDGYYYDINELYTSDEIDEMLAAIGEGKDGADGQDGKSAYQLAVDSGYTGTQTQWLASLKGAQGIQGVKGDKGDKGDKGADGQNGTTPVKGVDYWTQNDKAEVIAEALQSAAKPEFVNSLAECANTSKLYVLPDGYLYAYVQNTKITHPNVFDKSKAALNTRLSTSSTGAENGMFVTDYLPVDFTALSPYVVRVKGLDIIANYNNARMHFYNSSKTKIGNAPYLYPLVARSTQNCPVYADDNDGYYLNADYYASVKNSAGTLNTNVDLSQVTYIRLSFNTGSTTAITVNDIKDITITMDAVTEQIITSGFAPIKVYQAGNYEDRVSALEAATNLINSKINNIPTGTNNVTVPNYWQSAVDEAISTIKLKQNISGVNCVNFAWWSDMHIVARGTNLNNKIGIIAKSVMSECDIPFAVVSGDINESGNAPQKSYVENNITLARSILKPLGKDVLLTRGNHDIAYGGSSAQGTAYAYHFTPQEVWNKLYRFQVVDERREFSADGTYYFADNKSQKTRFIMLNSQWSEYAQNEDGTVVYNSQQKAGYGQAQLDWLANTALNMPSGYTAIIVTHTPPCTVDTVNYDNQSRDNHILRRIISAYCNKTTYTGSYTGTADWQNVSVNVNFTNAVGSIAGVFCGHCHKDRVVTNTLPCPIITITCSANIPYDSNESTRTSGTATETALDFVTIDKTNRKIYLTRLGVGDDREVDY